MDLPYTYSSTVRPPSYKDLVEEIKKLEGEKFQLQLRVYLKERNGKISTKEIVNMVMEYIKEDTLRSRSRDLEVEVNELRTQLAQAQATIEEKTSIISTLESNIQDKDCAIAVEYKKKEQHLTKKLDETCEELLTKSNLVSSLEVLIKEKDLENSKLKDKRIQMIAALKAMGYRTKDMEKENSSLKIQNQELKTKYDELQLANNELIARSSHQDPSMQLNLQIGLRLLDS